MKKYILGLFLMLIICAITMTVASAANGPSAQDLKDINSGIEYPRDNEYFDTYRYATIKAPGGHSVYAYGSADRMGSRYTAADGDRVLLLAERKGVTCCIVLSQNKGRWINSDYLVLDPLPTPTPASTPKPMTTPKPIQSDSVSYLNDYKTLIDLVLKKTKGSYFDDELEKSNSGMLYDFDEDGYRELVITYLDYENNEYNMKALLARRKNDGSTHVYEKTVCPFAGGAKATVYYGTFGEKTVFHLVFTNSLDGEAEIGRDTIITMQDGVFVPLTELEWDLDGCYVSGEKDNNLFNALYGTRKYIICGWGDGNTADSLDSLKKAVS